MIKLENEIWPKSSLSKCLQTLKLSVVCYITVCVCVCVLQEEYSTEQIQWYPMPVKDFHSCLELISSRPHGILRILDDQTCLPQVHTHTHALLL